MDFSGKVGLVTGAASGIGRATALGFAQRGGAVDQLGCAVRDVVGRVVRGVGVELDLEHAPLYCDPRPFMRTSDRSICRIAA